MNKRTTKMTMVVLMLLAVSLYFVSGTYARYTSEFTGSSSVEIAKWVVEVQGSASETFNATFTTDESDYVKTGKIAPESSISSDILVDLTGTEVAVKITADIDKEDLRTLFGDLVDNVEVKATVNGNDGEAIVDLDDIGEVTVKVTITWKEGEEETEWPEETKLGIAGGSVNFPVVLTVQQYLG